jgi:hypothetical protein
MPAAIIYMVIVTAERGDVASCGQAASDQGSCHVGTLPVC